MKDTLVGFLIGILLAALIYTNYVDKKVVVSIPTETPYAPTQVFTQYAEPTWTPFYAISVATPTIPSLNQVLGQPDGSNPFTGENP